MSNPPTVTTAEDLSHAVRSEIIPALEDDEIPSEFQDFLKLVDDKSRMRFLNWLPRDQKYQVMARGSLQGTANPSATLEYRMEIAVGGPLIPPLEHFLKAHQLSDDMAQQLRALPDQTQAAVIGRGGFKVDESQDTKDRIMTSRISSEKVKEATRFKEEYQKLIRRAEEVGDIVFREPRKRASSFSGLPEPVGRPVQSEHAAKKLEINTTAIQILKDIESVKTQKKNIPPKSEDKQIESKTNNNQIDQQKPPQQQKVDMTPIREINELHQKQQQLAAKNTSSLPAAVSNSSSKVVVAAAVGPSPSATLRNLIDKSKQSKVQQQSTSPELTEPKEEKKEIKVKREHIDDEIRELPPPDLSIQQKVKRSRSDEPTLEDLLQGVTALIQREIRRNMKSS